MDFEAVGDVQTIGHTRSDGKIGVLVTVVAHDTDLRTNREMAFPPAVDDHTVTIDVTAEVRIVTGLQAEEQRPFLERILDSLCGIRGGHGSHDDEERNN